jgi:hypothetical protein
MIKSVIASQGLCTFVECTWQAWETPEIPEQAIRIRELNRKPVTCQSGGIMLWSWSSHNCCFFVGLGIKSVLVQKEKRIMRRGNTNSAENNVSQTCCRNKAVEVACLYSPAFSSSEVYTFSSDAFSSCSLHWQLLWDSYSKHHNLFFATKGWVPWCRQQPICRGIAIEWQTQLQRKHKRKESDVLMAVGLCWGNIDGWDLQQNCSAFCPIPLVNKISQFIFHSFFFVALFVTCIHFLCESGLPNSLFAGSMLYPARLSFQSTHYAWPQTSQFQYILSFTRVSNSYLSSAGLCSI